VPKHHTMEYMGRRGKAPHTFLTSVLDGGEWSALCSCCFTTGQGVLVPTGHEAGWTPQPVLCCRRLTTYSIKLTHRLALAKKHNISAVSPSSGERMTIAKACSSTLRLEAVRSSETSVDFYWTARRSILNPVSYYMFNNSSQSKVMAAGSCCALIFYVISLCCFFLTLLLPWCILCIYMFVTYSCFFVTVFFNLFYLSLLSFIVFVNYYSLSVKCFLLTLM
jgi:hypothetical protein